MRDGGRHPGYWAEGSSLSLGVFVCGCECVCVCGVGVCVGG